MTATATKRQVSTSSGGGRQQRWRFGFPLMGHPHIRETLGILFLLLLSQAATIQASRTASVVDPHTASINQGAIVVKKTSHPAVVPVVLTETEKSTTVVTTLNKSLQKQNKDFEANERKNASKRRKRHGLAFLPFYSDFN